MKKNYILVAIVATIVIVGGAYIFVVNRRMCHVRKAILKWMRNNRPDLVKKFEREAIKAFPLNQTPPENGR